MTQSMCALNDARFGAIKGDYALLVRTLQTDMLLQFDDLKLNAVVSERL